MHILSEGGLSKVEFSNKVISPNTYIGFVCNTSSFSLKIKPHLFNVNHLNLLYLPHCFPHMIPRPPPKPILQQHEVVGTYSSDLPLITFKIISRTERQFVEVVSESYDCYYWQASKFINITHWRPILSILNMTTDNYTWLNGLQYLLALSVCCLCPVQV